MEHQDKFKSFHKESHRSLKSLASQALSAVISRERRKRNEEDKQKKARMKALKENDMEAYRALLEETKNDRLSNLLKETETYMQQLGAMAQGDGTTNVRSWHAFVVFCIVTHVCMYVCMYVFQSGTYESYHNVVEEICEQPKMLQFGTLKDYQVCCRFEHNSNTLIVLVSIACRLAMVGVSV